MAKTRKMVVLGDASAYALAVAEGYEGTKQQFAQELTGATAAARAAAQDASDAEAYAIGKRGGVDVGSSDPAYHNNAKYYKEFLQVDDTLSVPERAADAKKTGDEIAGLKRQIDDMQYNPITIKTFTASPATAEKGSTVQTIDFTYTFNKTPTTLKLNTETLTPGSTSTQKTGLTVASNTTYTLTATDSGSHTASPATATKTAAIKFYDKIHYGAAATPEAYNDNFLLTTMTNHELSADRAKTFTTSAASGKYIFYALPTSMGTPKFNVGGFDGGFTKVAEFAHTNASGYTTTYAVYKSDNPGLGTTEVVVS